MAAPPATPAPPTPESRRERKELITGFVCLGLGIALLLASFVIAAGFVLHPGDFLRSQISNALGNESKGPTASFTFTVTGFGIDAQSTSRPGDAGISQTSWDWGDGGGSGGPTASHTYSGNFSGFARLTVRDSNGRESVALGEVRAGPGVSYQGNSMADPGNLAGAFDVGAIFGPVVGALSGVVIALLVFAGLFTMWLAGASITKAGWNLIKPKPEMVRVRVKPKDLEVEPVYPQAAAYAPPQGLQEPPPPP